MPRFEFQIDFKIPNIFRFKILKLGLEIKLINNCRLDLATFWLQFDDKFEILTLNIERAEIFYIGLKMKIINNCRVESDSLTSIWR